MSVAALCVAGGCADDTPVLRPVIELPEAGSAADPWSDVDQLEISVAREGDDTPLATRTFSPGEEPALSGLSFSDDVVVHLTGRVRGVEIAYGRTCPVDVRRGDEPPRPHLYFARIVEWGRGPALEAPGRVGASAYAPPDGSAVFVGGGPTIDRVERFDPLAGSFATLAATVAARTDALVAPFGDGRALVVGGVNAGGNAVPFVEVIDPEPGVSFSRQVRQYDGPGLADHAAASLVDGSVLVAGGRAQAGPSQPFAVTSDAWLFRFGVAGELEPPILLSGAMRSPRAGHTLTRLGDEPGADVLVVGGQDDAGVPIASIELYRPLRGVFETVAAALAVPRWGHVAVRMPGGFVLVAGGWRPGPDGAPMRVRELELYDPYLTRFTDAGLMPQDAGLTEMTVTPLADGRVLFAGGRDATGTPTDEVLIARLDPVDGQIDLSETASLDVPRAGHAAVRLCDGTVLVVGGTTDPAAAPSIRYNPPAAGRR